MSEIHPAFDSNPMPNEFFNLQQEYDVDKDLYDSLLTEAYNKNGVPSVFYKVDYDTTNEKMLGEDNDRTIIRKFEIMTYFELQMEHAIYSKFGIEGIDNTTIFVSKKHFETASTYGLSGGEYVAGVEDSYIPHEGDILKTGFNNYFYEILNVNMENEQFLQEKGHSYALFVKPFKDEHLSVSVELSGANDEILKYVDIDPDIFDQSEIINDEKEDILFNISGDNVEVNNPYGGW